MRIGELAACIGVNPKTVRYYEGIGLLPTPARQPSGYREYSDEDVDRLRFVRTAQRLGLSLSEISEILAFRERGERPCAYVLEVLDRQVADLDRRMAEMVELRRELIALKAEADRLPNDETCFCAVIEHSGAAVTGAVEEAPRRVHGSERNGLTDVSPTSNESGAAT